MNETTAADSSHHQQSNEVSLTITLADLETQSTVSTLTGHLTTAKKVAPIKFLLLSILSHALWSCYPVLSRYLQVFASPTLNGMVFVSTSRTAATMLLLLVNMGHAIIPSIVWDCGKPASSQTQEDIAGRETDEEDDRIKEDTSEVSDTNFIRYKLQVLVIFGCASALRAMFAVTAARLTLAYNIGMINCLGPILGPLADHIVLNYDIPTSLWPTVLITSICCFVVLLSRSPILNQELDQGGSISNKDNVMGCSAQLFSIFWGILARIMMKKSKGIASRNEMSYTANVSIVIIPVLLSLSHSEVWEGLMHLSVWSVLAWLTVTVFVFCVADPLQIHVVREIGPTLFSSFFCVRLLGTVLFSGILLNEPVQTLLEGLCLLVTLLTITIYTWDLSAKEGIVLWRLSIYSDVGPINQLPNVKDVLGLNIEVPAEVHIIEEDIDIEEKRKGDCKGSGSTALATTVQFEYQIDNKDNVEGKKKEQVQAFPTGVQFESQTDDRDNVEEQKMQQDEEEERRKGKDRMQIYEDLLGP